MRPDEFFEIIDGIDDDIILDIPENNAEQPTEIVIEGKGTPFWAVALSAACLLCVLVSGVFVIAKIRTSLPVDSGANASASPEDSSFESDPNLNSSDCSDNGDESSDSNSDSLDNEEDEPPRAIVTPDAVETVLSRRILLGKIKAGETIYSEPCMKYNDLDYAVVYIDKCSNITEDDPVYISIWKYVGSDMVCVSETLKITHSEKQEYTIRYTEPCGRHTRCILKKEYKSTSNDYATLDGHWKP